MNLYIVSPSVTLFLSQLKTADEAYTAQLRTVQAAKNAVKKATRDVDLANKIRSSGIICCLWALL